MKKNLAFISILLFLLLLWFTKRNYDNCCSNNKVVEEEKVEEILIEEALDPITFTPNSSIANINKGWEELKNTILSNQDEEQILQIMAPYTKAEGKKLGVERAKSAYLKLEADLDSAKIEYEAYLIEIPEESKTKPISGAKFNWLTKNENIEELGDKALIYFPNNSTKKIENENIKNYLSKIVQKIKGTDKKVYLSGHTDNIGNPIKNKTLSKKRAESIKNELIILGLNNDQIIVEGFGDEKPIADNATADGRQKNRRVELQMK